MTSPIIMSGREAGPAQLKKIQSQLYPIAPKRPPCLVVIQVGNNPASASYIRQKKKTAEDFGLRFIHAHLSSDSTEAQIAVAIQMHAVDSGVDGIILQLPLDTTIPTEAEAVNRLLIKIPPEKDADGLHAENLGRLFSAESTAKNWQSPLPATALGVYRLLEHYKIPLVGKDIVVVGKSRLVGMPAAGILLHAGATVTICHSKTLRLEEKTRNADIVVAAAGRMHLIGPSHLREGAVVVDVGIHQKPDGKLTGDVDPAAFAKCSAYSPVPGGVGPMTVAMLIENTMRLHKNAAL